MPRGAGMRLPRLPFILQHHRPAGRRSFAAKKQKPVILISFWPRETIDPPFRVQGP
jgi:hypothetical protein